MPNFLRGRALEKAIGEILGEPDCRAAVAFWGRGSEDRLPGKGAGDYKIICNLLSGGTNPYAIEKLKLSSVRHSEVLHAKVYLGRDRAVIASANVSANGLGLEGREQAKWIEAGVEITETHKVAEWFEQLWSEAREVTDADMADAKRVWAQRQRAKPTVRFIGDFQFARETFPLVFWEGQFGDWEYVESSIKKQLGDISDEIWSLLDNGLEAWGDEDLKVMSRGRWVLVWQRKRNGSPAKRPAPYWFMCGQHVPKSFKYKRDKQLNHVVLEAALDMPEPFSVAGPEFFDLFCDVISREKFSLLRTEEYPTAWMTSKRVALMREFWLEMQRESARGSP